MADYSQMSDDQLLALARGASAGATDYSKMSDQELIAHAQAAQAGPSVSEDVAKSAAIGVPKGLIAGAGSGGDFRNLTASGMGWLAEKMGASPEKAEAIRQGAAKGFGPGSWLPSSSGIQQKVEQYTGKFYEPQTPQGKIAEAVTSSVSNPVSYVGPGGLPLKIGGAVLAGAGGEGARQAAEGTAYEKPAQIAGALAGGAAAAKGFGPTAAKAAVPTAQELRAAADQGYAAARNSGLTLDPRGVASWATTTEQQLNARGFTGGTNGTAPKTMGVLSDLQSPPAGSVIGASNIDTIRANLRQIAEEVQPSAGGAIKATPDAAAATQALKNLGSYTENIPSGHIMAGDAAAYVRAIKEANANYGAASRVRDFDTRLTKAERAADRQVAGSLDNQIKAKAGQMLDRGARGLNAEEKAQLELINSGTWGSETLRQLGRGGAGVVPLGAQIIGAAATGGSLLPYQIPLAAALYGARKGSEAITKSRAEKLGEMLAKRSPEYENRVAALPPAPSNAPNVAALVRALLAH